MILDLFLLLVAHAIGDMPLQPSWLSRAKRSTWWGLPAHAAIHAVLAGAVLLSWPVALAELVAHTVIDFAKCRRWIDTGTDQMLHVLSKVIWVALLV